MLALPGLTGGVRAGARRDSLIMTVGLLNYVCGHIYATTYRVGLCGQVPRIGTSHPFLFNLAPNLRIRVNPCNDGTGGLLWGLWGAF